MLEAPIFGVSDGLSFLILNCFKIIYFWNQRCRFHLNSRYNSTGAPRNAVIAPTGKIAGAISLLATISAKSSRIAPKNADDTIR